MDLKYLEVNKRAIKEFTESFPDIGLAFRQDARDAISYLRILGLRCARCGKNNITTPNMELYNYGPEVCCYSCQQKNKLVNYSSACRRNKNNIYDNSITPRRAQEN